jgi:hypothetical protein
LITAPIWRIMRLELVMMTILEMIAEWRKGCTCAGPDHDRAFGLPEGTTSATECADCTEALIDAIEAKARRDEADAAAAACTTPCEGGITLPEVKRVDLEHPQIVADKMRECAALVAQPMPEIASALTIGADQIETLCDAIKAQESLIGDMRQGIIDLGSGAA